MKLIKRAIFVAMMTAAGSLFAQAGVSLETEIQNMERTAAMQGINAQERHDALVRLARLRQLSGDIEGAARNWLDAAAAIPGSIDEDDLLSCAYCLAAMGEWDRAAAALAPLLTKSSRARFLNISITAIKTGNVSGLSAIADSGEYSAMKSEIYFMLWKTSNAEAAETWRRRLAAEFPQTPEGRLASGSASVISVKTSPFWLLSGMDSLMENPEAAPRPAASPAPVTASVPAVSQPPIPQPAAQTARLQTGLFSRHDNAQAQMANLRQAGFSPSIEQRGEMWAVTVPAGTDQTRSIIELREAGFDSFPIR
jgi:tetratricopeptide (TPR) repeat protein